MFYRNPPDRFHKETPLPAEIIVPSAGEKKHVTVLISDLSGFTVLSQRLDPEELNELIEKQVMRNISAAVTSKIGGPKRASEILGRLDGSVESQILDKIKEADPELGNKIEEMMVVFESLISLSDRDIQTLLREVSSETLLVALRGAEPGIRNKIMGNMSKRAAELLRDDLEAMPPVKLSDVETAQKEIMASAKRLAEAGEITLGTKGEQLV